MENLKGQNEYVMEAVRHCNEAMHQLEILRGKAIMSAENDDVADDAGELIHTAQNVICLLYTSPSPRDS